MNLIQIINEIRYDLQLANSLHSKSVELFSSGVNGGGHFEAMNSRACIDRALERTTHALDIIDRIKKEFLS